MHYNRKDPFPSQTPPRVQIVRFNDAIANKSVDHVTGVHIHRQYCFELLVLICEKKSRRSTAHRRPTRRKQVSHLKHDVFDLTVQLLDVDLHR